MARHNFTLRLSAEERASLKAEADADGRSVNDLLRRRLFPTPLTNADAKADLAGTPRPDHPTVEAQVEHTAVAPTHRPAPSELEVRAAASAIGEAAQTEGIRRIVEGTPTYAQPRSQAELDEARGISIERQQAAQKRRDEILRGSRKEKG